MVDIPASPKDKVVIDAMTQQWQTKVDAIETISPRYDKLGRIDLITILAGKRPNMYKLYQAKVQLEGLMDLEQLKTPVIADDLFDFIRTHAPSLDAKRSEQIMEIAKSETHEEPLSILDRISSRLGKK